MPINYKEYHPKWSLISRLIRFKRARNRCELCGLQNGSIGYRDKSGDWHDWVLSVELTYAQHSALCKKRYGTYLRKIVLTVAHLDHDKTNNKFWNLKALCQRCHLKHDIKQHIFNRKYGRKTKYLNLRLFE